MLQFLLLHLPQKKILYSSLKTCKFYKLELKNLDNGNLLYRSLRMLINVLHMGTKKQIYLRRLQLLLLVFFQIANFKRKMDPLRQVVPSLSFKDNLTVETPRIFRCSQESRITREETLTQSTILMRSNPTGLGRKSVPVFHKVIL